MVGYSGQLGGRSWFMTRRAGRFSMTNGWPRRSDKACEDVGRPASGKADNDAHRPRWIGLRPRNSRDGRERGSACGQMQEFAAGKFHFVLHHCNSHNGLPCLPALNGATCALGNLPQCLTARALSPKRAFVWQHAGPWTECSAPPTSRLRCGWPALEGIGSKRKGSSYRSGRSPDWLKMTNTACAAVKREAEGD